MSPDERAEKVFQELLALHDYSGSPAWKAVIARAIREAEAKAAENVGRDEGRLRGLIVREVRLAMLDNPTDGTMKDRADYRTARAEMAADEILLQLSQCGAERGADTAKPENLEPAQASTGES